MKKNPLKTTPYGYLQAIPNIEHERYEYVTMEEYEDGDFKTPSAWKVMDAMGGFMYFKARDRKKAQSLCNEFYGVGKYSVVSDKRAEIR